MGSQTLEHDVSLILVTSDDFDKLDSRTRLVAWLAVMSFALLGVSFFARILANKPLPEYFLEDFGFYEAAARKAWAGENPYDVSEIGPAFLYPPPSLLLILGLSILPSVAQAVVLPLSSIASLTFITYVYTRDCPRWLRWMLLAAGLFFGPFFLTTYVGQINALVAAAVAGGFFYLRRPDPIGKGGLWLSIAAQLKITPTLLLIVFANHKRKAVLATSLLSAALLCALTGLLFGFSHFFNYVGVLQRLSQTFPLGAGKFTLVATSQLVYHATHVDLFQHLALLQKLYLTFWLLVFLATAWRLKPDRSREMLFVLGTVIVTMVPNVVWYHHFIFIWGPALYLGFGKRDGPSCVRFSSLGTLLVIQGVYALPSNFRALAVQGSLNFMAMVIVVWLWKTATAEEHETSAPHLG